MVYIAEAHAFDEWKVSSGRFLPESESSEHVQDGVIAVQHQPKTAEERCALAREFCELYVLSYNGKSPVQVLVDDPEQGDLFEKHYAPWPLRLYMIDDASKTIEWIAQPKDCSYDFAVQELMGLLQLYWSRDRKV